MGLDLAESAELEAFEDGHELRMGFFEHLDELRHRLTRAVISLVIGTAIGFFIADHALNILREPFCRIPSVDNCELTILDPTGTIIVYFRVALMIGGILSVPMVTYQLMMFILPGLTRKEKRYVLASIPATTVLFLIGTVFSWYVLLPPALGFLEGFQPDIFEPEWTADLYLSFVTSLIFWMGVAFQTPLGVFHRILAGFRQCRHIDTTLAGGRHWRFNRSRAHHADHRSGQYVPGDGAAAGALRFEYRAGLLRAPHVRHRSRRLSFPLTQSPPLC